MFIRRKSASAGPEDMTEGVIWRQLLVFILPIMLGGFFQQLYNTADAFIVGNYVGKEALAAVGGATSAIINLLVGFFIGLASGGTVIIAQFYGAGEKEALQKALHTAVLLGVLCGGLLMVIGIPLAPYVLTRMDTPDDILDYAVVYMRVYFLGVIPNILYNIGAGVLRALGDSRRPLYVLIICCFANIVLDLLFVVVFHMEVFGAALATILSQFVSCVLVLGMLVKNREEACRLHWKKLRMDMGIFKRILLIGIPSGLQSSLYSISNVLIQSTINGFGTNTVAAWTVYGKIEAVFWLVISAFGIAVTTFVGQNYGERKYDRIKKCVNVSFVMAFAATAVISTVFVTCGAFIFRLFNQDPEVLEIGKSVLHMTPPLLFTYVSIEILSAAVRGTGDAIKPTIITLCGVCVLRVLWIYLVVPHFHTLLCVAFSYPLTWTVTSIVFWLYYRFGKWMKRAPAEEKQ